MAFYSVKYGTRQHIIFALFVVFVCVAPAFAQVPDVENDGVPDGGVQISPIRFEADLRPGDVWDKQLNLKNFSDETRTVTLSSENFIVTDDTESLSFYPSDDATQYQAPDIVDWVQIPQQTVTLAPGEARWVPFSVHVPDDAPTGGYYGALFVTQSLAESLGAEGSQIGINTRMGALLIFSVRGSEPVRIAGNLDHFDALQKLFFASPAKFTASISNSGNIHFRGGGLVTIARAGRTVATLPLDSQVSYPHKVRTYRPEWYFAPLNIGPYTATLKYESMSGLVGFEQSRTFWVIPWTSIVILIGVMMLLVGARHYVGSRYTITRK